MPNTHPGVLDTPGGVSDTRTGVRGTLSAVSDPIDGVCVTVECVADTRPGCIIHTLPRTEVRAPPPATRSVLYSLKATRAGEIDLFENLDKVNFVWPLSRISCIYSGVAVI